MSDITIATPDAFKAFVGELQGRPFFRQPLGWGLVKTFAVDEEGEPTTNSEVKTVNWQGKNLGAFAAYGHATCLFHEEQEDLWRDPELMVELDWADADRLCGLFAPYVENPEGHANVQAVLAARKDMEETPAEQEVAYWLVILFENVVSRDAMCLRFKEEAVNKHGVPAEGLIMEVRGAN